MTGAATSIPLSFIDAPLRKSLAALRAYGSGPIDAAFKAMGNAMVTATVLRFDTGRGPGGTPWKPSKRVLGMKVSLGGFVNVSGGKTLVLKGHLRNSQTYNLLAGHAGFEWGSPMVYARAHQLGSTRTVAAHSQSIWRRLGKDGDFALRKDGTRDSRFTKKRSANFETTVKVKEHKIVLPARPFLGVDQADREELTALGADFLKKEIAP